MQFPVEVVHRVSDQIKKTKVDCILIGGFAIRAYAYDRVTHDIDFLVRESDYDKLEKALLESGFREDQKSPLFTRFLHSSAKKFPIDFLSIDADSFNTIQKGAKKVTLAGRTFLIPSLNHLLALKLHSLKQGQAHRYQKDMFDVLELTRIHRIDVHAHSFKKICLKYATKEIYDKIKTMRG